MIAVVIKQRPVLQAIAQSSRVPSPFLIARPFGKLGFFFILFLISDVRREKVRLWNMLSKVTKKKRNA